MTPVGSPWGNSVATNTQMDLSVSSYEQAPSPKTVCSRRHPSVAKPSKLRQATLVNQNRFWALGNLTNSDWEKGRPEASEPITSRGRTDQIEKSKENKKNKPVRQKKKGKTTAKAVQPLSQLAAIAISKIMVPSPPPEHDGETDFVIDQFPSPRLDQDRVGELSQIIIQAAADLAIDTYDRSARPSSSSINPTNASSEDSVTELVIQANYGGQEPNGKRNAKRLLTPETKPSKRFDDKTTPDRNEEDDFDPFNSDDSYY